MPSAYYNTRLPADLRVLKEEIEAHARAYGLDFFETIFEVVDADDLNEIAAYGGFPTRYPHWSFGMQYEELKKGYDYGLSKIYEMVINNDPCYAYLMRCNHTVDQKLVMAHVYGHCDFFKNNAYFAHTNRKMMDEMANHGARIRRYVERFGEDEVESFLDRCLSIDDLIDIHSTAIRRRDDSSKYDFSRPPDAEAELRLTRFKSKDYMDEYINPRDALRAEEEERRKAAEAATRSFPERPEKDVLLFLIEHAPLKPWQRDVLSIIRDEVYYFMPQAQTKIMNEGWACVTGSSLVATDSGWLRMADLVRNRWALRVFDGETLRPVVDWAEFPDRECVRIRTRRGFVLEGSTTHRVRLANGEWRRLDEIVPGDAVALAVGADTWARDFVEIDWTPARRSTIDDVAMAAGVSVRTLYRHKHGVMTRSADRLAALLDQYEQDRLAKPLMRARKRGVTIPPVVDERFGAFLGYLLGDGHISVRKRTIGLTTGDRPQADDFAKLVQTLFGIDPRVRWDAGKWRVSLSSRHVQELLLSLGLQPGRCARAKSVPDVILRSPATVVAAFVRALFDCDGYAGRQGVILSTSSRAMSEVVQILLLNFGAVSSRRPHKDGCWHVHLTGRSAKVFQDQVGFGLERKRQALQTYLSDRRWFKSEDRTDAVVAVERFRSEVFDVTVAGTHRYVAQGLINHNSYWHSTIMTEKALEAWECIDYADHHSGTMAMTGGRLNPYKIGIELFRDIEHRWNTGQFGKEWEECDDLIARRKWDRKLGLGRQKIFEVRRVHNDITFIDTFLTPEFCVQHKLFTFAWQEQAGQYYIESRDFEKIKQQLLFSLTNFGKPWIYVIDGNYRNRGELLLRHDHAGADLKVKEAQDTLANLQYMWSRPVHLETVVDDKPTLWSFDGTEHTSKVIGDSDDRRSPSSRA